MDGDDRGMDVTLDKDDTVHVLEEKGEITDTRNVSGLREDEVASVHKLPSSESITVLVSVVNKKLDDIIANTNIVLDFSGCLSTY